MTKNEELVVDWRSTGRRRARKELFRNYIPYKCIDCGITVTEPPKDAPPWFDEIWPEENRKLESQLQADHESKDVTLNDIEFLNWRCPKHHKLKDLSTEKGVATETTKFF